MRNPLFSNLTFQISVDLCLPGDPATNLGSSCAILTTLLLLVCLFKKKNCFLALINAKRFCPWNSTLHGKKFFIKAFQELTLHNPSRFCQAFNVKHSQELLCFSKWNTEWKKGKLEAIGNNYWLQTEVHFEREALERAAFQWGYMSVGNGSLLIPDNIRFYLLLYDTLNIWYQSKASLTTKTNDIWCFAATLAFKIKKFSDWRLS